MEVLEKLSVLSLVLCSQAVHTCVEVLVTSKGVDVETLDRPDLGSGSTAKTWALISPLILLSAVPLLCDSSSSYIHLQTHSVGSCPERLALSPKQDSR